MTLAATLLTVGAGEAFLETKPRLQGNPMMKDHEGAGETVRFCDGVADRRARRACSTRPTGRRGTTLRVLAVLFAVSAVGFTIRTGHLGAKLVWDEDRRVDRVK